MSFFLTFIPLLIWQLVEYLLNLIVTIISPVLCRSYFYKAIRTYFEASLAVCAYAIALYFDGYTGSVLGIVLFSFFVGVFCWLRHLSSAYKSLQEAKRQNNKTAIENHSREVLCSYVYLFLVPILSAFPVLIPIFLRDFMSWTMTPLMSIFASQTGFWVCSIIGLITLLSCIPSLVVIVISFLGNKPGGAK